MPLIACPECAREVSKTAIACPSCGCPVGERVGTESAASQESWETNDESEPDDIEPVNNEFRYLPRLLPDADGAVLIVFRILGLWLFITGLLIWRTSADRIIDRIVLGADVAPLDPVYSFFYFGLSIGIGGMLIWWSGLLAIRDTQLEHWVRNNLNPWTAFAIGIGIYVLYIIAMSLTSGPSIERDLTGTILMDLDGSTCRDLEGAPVSESDYVWVYSGPGEPVAVTQLTDRVETGGVCSFRFRLSEVPTTESMYLVLVKERIWRFFQAELEASNWDVELDAAE